MTWNKKNDQFALSCGLRQSSERLQRWLLRRAKPNEVCEIEIDLRVFNQFIARDRDRGGYDRKTLKEALAQLDEKTQGLVLITKSYTWAIHKVQIRPLQIVLQQNSQNGNGSPKLKTGNPMFSEEHKKRAIEQQQQDISILKAMFDNLGLNYTYDAIVKLWRNAGKKVEDVKRAVEMMLHAHSTQVEPVRTPEAWLVRCIERKWYEKFSLYYQAKLPRFTNCSEIEQFVTGLMPSPT